MVRSPGKIFLILILLFAGMTLLVQAPRSGRAQGNLDLPDLPPPVEYGDVLISRTSQSNGMVPVVFSHWVHRAKFTCRVCHRDLFFSMRADETPIVCKEGKMDGAFCAVCHNGTTAFGPRAGAAKNCEKCHNASASPNREKFQALQKKLPRTEYGNGIDWTKALKTGAIKPKNSLGQVEPAIHLNRTLTLRAEMSGIPPAVFPHGVHEEWLDCSACHPELFNIKKKGTEHFSMARIVQGDFCGVCHRAVAFPLNDCKRCHPAMRR